MDYANSCGMLIKQLHDALEKKSNNALRKDDLTMAQVSALILLNDAPDKQLPLKQLEQLMRVAQSTAAGIVVRLEQKGLVTSFGDSADKRIKMVQITPHGEMCYLQAEQHMEQAEKALLSPLTESERDVFRTLLQKVSHAAQ